MNNINCEKKGDYILYKNPTGVWIGTANNKIKVVDGYIFRNLSGKKELLPYEDWRRSAVERARDLASRLSIKEIAGLMLYSSHQCVPFHAGSPFQATYLGKSYEESNSKAWELTDQQKDFLKKDGIRHVLLMRNKNTEAAARWNNQMQKLAEELPFGLPVNISTDPRHGARKAHAEFEVSEGDVSKWPEGIGMAALFSPELCETFAEIAAKEYRAMGICTALGPQIDLATEPRWMRFNGTFGTAHDMAIAMTRACCDGLQTTKDTPDGWGRDSVAAMVKHWPGGGTGEGGRDAHYPFGAYAVFPGNNFKEHTDVFTEGAFHLNGPTQKAASVMPYYTVSWQQDIINNENVGNSYSEYLIKDLLREQNDFDGVVCTDWGIMEDPDLTIDSFGSRCYNQEKLSETERYLKVIMNGIDQFGGINKSEPIVNAYELGCEKYGQEVMRTRLEKSAFRLLLNSFRCGLFDNPFVDVENSIKTVGAPEYVKAGYEAQVKSVVLLKNHNSCLPINKEHEKNSTKKPKVYIPNRFEKAKKGFFRKEEPEMEVIPVEHGLVFQYFEPAPIESADFAIVFVKSPMTDPYSVADVINGGNGYLPISLQYRPYTADEGRAASIAGGDFREDFTNRSYKGKTNRVANESDLDLIINTKKIMGNKPVIVCMNMDNPTVMAELEPYADAIMVEFGVQKKAVFDLLTGKYEPSGLLPFIMPKNMETIERHKEDVAFDYEAYIDEDGNVYEYGFGLNFTGRIKDERTTKWILA